MHFHTGNVFYVVVRNFHSLIFQVHNHISIIQMLDPPYDFMSINTLHVVMRMEDPLSMIKNSVNCVRLIKNKLLPQNFIS